MEILACPLLNKMIWNNKHRLMTKPQTLHFLCRRDHCKGLSSPHDVCKERISTVHNSGDCIGLMLAELDFGVHSVILDVTSVILTRSGGIEFLVIELAKFLTTLRVLPYPILKGSLDFLLFALCDCCLMLIQNRFRLSATVINIIKDAHVLEVQGVLDNLVGIDSACTVNRVRFYIGLVVGFVRDDPLSSLRNILDAHVPSCPRRCAEKSENKVLNDVVGHPSGAEFDTDFRGCQILRLDGFKSFHIDGILRETRRNHSFRSRKLLTDIAGEVVIGGKIFRLIHHGTFQRI